MNSETQSPTTPVPQAAVWQELRVTCPAEAGDVMTGFLWELSAQGITEEPSSRNGLPWVRLLAYFQTDSAEALRAQIQERLKALEAFYPGTASGRISVRQVEQEDWNANWKANFKPLHVTSRLVIRPVWEEYLAQAHEVVLHLDPGMAFGTGAHESTRGCLRVIDALFGAPAARLPAAPPPKTVLDVGTGSGILLIAALKLGADRALGIDIDPLAIKAATENCELNLLLDQVELSSRLLKEVDGSFDLVLANILSPTLLEMVTQLPSRVAPGGWLVLSGMLIVQGATVREAYSQAGLHCVEVLEDGEWTTLVFQRPTP